LLFLAATLLQAVPEVRADVSAQDKEAGSVAEEVKKK